MRWIILLLFYFSTVCHAEEETWSASRFKRPTDSIKSLSVEQAQSLKPGGTGLYLGGLISISPEVARELVRPEKNPLPDYLDKLGGEAAKTLKSTWRAKGSIHLEGLSTLSPEAARELSNVQGDLILSGLKTLSPETSENLARLKGRSLDLEGLENLSLEAAKHFQSFKGTLLLNGLQKCNSELADVLSKTEAEIHMEGVIKNVEELKNPKFARMLLKGSYSQGNFDNLTDLSLEVATVFGDECNSLLLPKVNQISPKIAEQLIRVKYVLILDGLLTLDEDVAKELSVSRKGYLPDLSLNGLSDISVEVANHLSKKRGYLSLSGLSSLKPKVASSLGAKDGRLILNGVKQINADVAFSLGKRSGSVYLGVSKISVDAAKALAMGDHPREIWFTGLTTLNAEAAEALVANKSLNIMFPRFKAENSTPQLSQVFAKAKCWITFTSLSEMTTTLARDLGFYSSNIKFPSIREINVEQAKFMAGNTGILQFSDPLFLKSNEAEEVLNQFSGHTGTLWLYRAGLFEDDPILAGLKNHKGFLWLSSSGGLLGTEQKALYLDESVAQKLVQSSGKIAIFDVTFLTDDVAKILAKRTAWTYFRDLRNISQEALTILQKNKNIFLPEELRKEKE